MTILHRKFLCVLMSLVMLVASLPFPVFGDESAVLSSYNGKVISVLGDSISTFAGYIPTADGFNKEHLARYPQDNLLTDVHETWWMQVIEQLGAKLGINDSWRGATVSGAAPVTSGTSGENASMSNLVRIQNLGANGIPDVIIFYGGTNDLAHVAKIGSFDSATAPTSVDLTTAKWDNLADGYVHTLLRLQYYYPHARIVALLPTVTASYYNDDKLAQGNAVLTQICQHYNIPFTDLRNCGITVADLPDGIHPNATGMDYITDAVLSVLSEQPPLSAEEHIVYRVTHSLQNVTASCGYYKGIDAGTRFSETFSCEPDTVRVTMGGTDITVDCYQNGTVTIPVVSGDLVITATAKAPFQDHLQALPAPYYNRNLWPLLAHDIDYYYIDHWTVHASGNVCSVTVPVEAGERLYATSFQAAGQNGGSLNGIRVTFFQANKTISRGAAEIYAEFSQNGYITVPEQVVAVNIPMWNDTANEELYIWEALPPNALGSHYQPLPENVCSAVNLWTFLTPQNDYYTGKGWGNLSTGQVWSITIPVQSGDMIYASSFEKYGLNGNDYNTVDAIRVTWFDKDGTPTSRSAGTVYAQFIANGGYLIVPTNIVAVNIPMWHNSDSNQVYLLNREHAYENGECRGCGAMLFGDVNRNNVFNTADIRCVILYTIGMQTMIDITAQRFADANEDGIIDSRDARLLLLALAEM